MIFTRRFSYRPKLGISIPWSSFAIWQEDSGKSPVIVAYESNTFQSPVTPEALINDPVTYFDKKPKENGNSGNELIRNFFSIYNEGNGMAYDITVINQIDLRELISWSKDPTVNLFFQFKKINNGIQVLGMNAGCTLEKKRLIGNCGNKEFGNEVSVYLPYGFILILASWAKYVVSISKDQPKRGFSSFEGPSLFFGLHYKDLGGKPFKDKYRVRFRIAHFSIKQDKFPREIMCFNSSLESVSAISYFGFLLKNFLSFLLLIPFSPRGIGS